MNNFTTSARAHPQLRRGKGGFAAGLRALVVCFALLIHAGLAMDFLSSFQGLVAFTLLLLLYLYFEIKNLWTPATHLFWINPVVLASIFTFVIAFGVTNVIFLLPEDVLDLVGLRPVATKWMNQLMLLVVLGACAMWIGYNSGAGRNVGLVLQRSRVLHKWMSSSVRVNKGAIYACLAISLMARLLAIELGVYGYSSTYAMLSVRANYREYLSMGDLLGRLALVALAMQSFASPRSTLSDRLLLWLVLGYEVLFGFLSGFKSQVIMPFMITGFVFYSQRNRFPRWFIPIIVVGIMAAYAVIEPFRAVRQNDSGFVGTNLISIVTTMTNASNTRSGDSGEYSSTWIRFLARSNLTYEGSLGIEYAAENELPEGSPNFLSNIFLAPLHAIIPRFLWEDKPLETTGGWYTNQVVGQSSISATAMSPFTYLNFAGGPLAVIIGFLIVGILHRGLFDGLRGFGAGGLIVLFGLLGTLVLIDSSFNNFLTVIIRYLPILVLAQYVLLRRPPRSVGKSKVSNGRNWQTGLL